MSGAVIRQLATAEQTYSLVFKFGTMRQAEAVLGGTSVLEVLARGLGLEEISAIVWAALQPHHPMSREEADDLLDAIGMPPVAAMLAEALKAFFGARVQVEGGNALAAAKLAATGPKQKASRRS